VVPEAEVIVWFRYIPSGGPAVFYIKTLKKAWSVAETPYPKKNCRLPTILSQEEVARLIDAARTPERVRRIFAFVSFAFLLLRMRLTRLACHPHQKQPMIARERRDGNKCDGCVCGCGNCSCVSVGTAGEEFLHNSHEAGRPH